jgi:signal transduction histidine kinase
LEHIISGDLDGESIARRIVNNCELTGLQASLRPKESPAIAVELWTAAICLPRRPEVIVVAMASLNVDDAVMDSLRAFSGALSHDLGNIFRAIDGYLRLLSDVLPQIRSVKKREDAAKLKTSLSYLTVIQDSLERARQVQDNLSAFAQHVILQPAPFAPKSIIDQIVKEMKENLREHGVELKTVRGPCLPHVSADSAAIEGVLRTLVDCSRRALPNGGEIVIDCAAVEVSRGASNATPAVQPGQYLRITISDSRESIDATTVRAAFRPFSRLPQRTGLELAAVAGLLHCSGGYIEAESPSRSGIAFRIYLPTARAVSSFVAEPIRVSKAVLVANDEPTTLTLIKDILLKVGYTVIAAPDGRKAIELAEHYAGTIDLLIADVTMPGMDGWTLATHISNSRPETKILIVSGYDCSHDHKLQGRNFLQVPFTPEGLMRKVLDVLES